MSNISHNRRSVRLNKYNYSKPGYYYVTICTHGKKHMFGTVRNNKMVLNEWGEIAHICWNDLPTHYNNCELDEFQTMPNHIHGIIIINGENNNVGDADLRPLRIDRTKMLLSKIVHGFKSTVTRKIHIEQQNLQPVWQRSFYDRVIRNDNELYNTREYINNNPINWALDKYNIS